MLEEAYRLAADLGDERELAHAKRYLGEALTWYGDVERGARLLDEALAWHRTAPRWTVQALTTFYTCAQANSLLGHTDRAVTLLEECQRICASLGERWALSWSEWHFGVVWWTAGALRKASARLREALRRKRELRDDTGAPFCLEPLGWVAAAEGDPRRAASSTTTRPSAKRWERKRRPVPSPPTCPGGGRC
ncbi:hypothetical protein [Amycolatopsis pigmentata]|uniref:MalT-like TPR region domain-containing protein n=1 Tax=Amycolatopsis pigmentata TaxID=450801 RepID=A0ABW5FMM8_9PSEU